MPKPRRRSKYAAVPTVVDGKRFDSKREAKRYQELVLLQKAGVIRNLECQVPFALSTKGKVVGHYIADFVYWESKERIVEDTKGFKTELYRWKSRHMRCEHGIDIRET